MVKKQKVKRYHVSSHTKQTFYESLVLMLSSGVDVASSLEGIKNESTDKKLNELISAMLTEIYNGTPFWKTLEMFDIVSENMSKVIKVGEESGNLNRNLMIVLQQQRKDKEINSKLRSASLYPMIVFAVLIVVGLGVAIFILPKLVEVYTSLKVELPEITKVVINVGRFMGGDGKYLVIGGIVLFIVLMYMIFAYKKTKWIGQNIMFSFGPIRNVLAQLEFSRMGFLMSGLLASGFSIVDSFRILANTTSLHFYTKFYNKIADGVEQGETFSSIFSAQKDSKKLFPIYIRQSLSTAEKSGGVQSTFDQINSTFEMEHQNTVNNLSTAFEPILLFVVWIFVAVLAISVILPIYSLVGSFTDVEGTNRTTAPTNTVTEVPPPTSAEVKTAPVVPAPTNVKVNANVKSAKIYSKVSGGKILVYAKANEQFLVKSSIDGWYQIEYKPGKLGWIRATEVSLVKQTQ